LEEREDKEGLGVGKKIQDVNCQRGMIGLVLRYFRLASNNAWIL